MYIAFVVGCNKSYPRTLGISEKLEDLEKLIFENREATKYKVKTFIPNIYDEEEDSEEEEYIPDIRENYDEIIKYTPPDPEWFEKFYDESFCGPAIYIIKFTKNIVDIRSILEDLYPSW